MSRLLLLAFLSLPLLAADREFKSVVDAISGEFHTRPMHIPFFGLVNVVTFVAHPAGAKHVDLAIFQNLDQHTREGQNVLNSLRHAVGPDWKPFFQARSFRHGDEEDTLIYLREEGRDWKLLLVTVAHDESVVVQLKLDPAGLERWVKDPLDSSKHWRGDSH